MKKALVWLLWQVDIWGSILSAKLVQWSGKSPYPIHPKHFLGTRSHHWYLTYIGAEDVVLDVGCGNAMHAIACAPFCREVYGFDCDSKQLEIGKSKACQEGLSNIHLTAGNAETHWGLAEGRFDKVIFLDALEHLHQRDFALREAYRVLKPDGCLLLSVPQRDTSWKKLRSSVGLFDYADLDHKVEYTQEEIEKVLAQNGFISEAVEPVSYDTWLAGLIDLAGGFSFKLYRWLAKWKREVALQKPAESTGFRIVARKR